jgi:ATP-binding cassette subfamily C protein CydD
VSPTRRILALGGASVLVPACALLAAAVAGLAVGQWTLVAAVVDAVVSRRAGPAALAGPLVALLGVWAVRSAVVAARDRLADAVSTRVRADARMALARKLLRLGPGSVADERAGELASTATEGVSALDAFVARFLPGAVTAAVTTPLVIAAVLVLDPLSGALLLVTAPLVVVFVWLVGTRAAAAAAERWEALGRLGALLLDTLRVLPTLVTFGRARTGVRWLNEASEAYRTTTLRVLRVAFLSGFVIEFGASLCVALVAVTVGIRLFEGQLGFERALLVLLLAPEVFAPLRALGADHHARLESLPAARRLFALLDQPEPTRGDRRLPTGVPPVRLDGVTVRHGDQNVLDHLDLDLPPGSRTAVVGPSGVGKTTLLEVLLGFRAPDTGEILIAGVPLSEVDPDVWRAKIAYLPERPWLLPGSIAANVRLGRPDATDAEIERALARAAALDFIRRLPDGIATRVGEDGAWLSGGERLRIGLARVFVADAAVVLLDEPTSQLDSGNEAAVLTALAEVARGRTVITVTHRPALLPEHDRVLELTGGRLREAQVVE